MATPRRRTRTRRTRTRRPSTSSTARLVNWLIGQAAETFDEMTDNDKRVGFGVFVLAPLALGIVTSMVLPSVPLLAWLRGVTLWLVGFGWPLLAGGLGLGAAMLIHPPFARGLKRYQGVAAVLGAWALLALFSVAWAPAGGMLGRVASVPLTRGLGGAGAVLVLLAILALAAVFAARLRIVQVVGHAVQPKRLAAAVRARLRGAKAPAAPKAGEDAGETGDGDMPAKAKVVGQPATALTPRPGVALAAADDQTDDTGPVLAPAAVAASAAAWTLPSLDLLEAPKPRSRRQEAAVQANVATIEDKLKRFGIEARVRAVNNGPSVTRYVVEIAADVQVTRVEKLAKDLALALAAKSIRIQAPIPGLDAIGIEVPNPVREKVTMRELFESEGLAPTLRSLAIGVGSDVAGKAVVGDLAKMPHLLVAGTTGSGKSVFVNELICSLLMGHSPETLRLILVDPKRVELAGYNGLPHLAYPVIVEPGLAAEALARTRGEMDRRYKLLARDGVRNIGTYNEKRARAGEPPMAYIVGVIDELADLMMAASEAKKAKGEPSEELVHLAQLEETIVHLAQMSRAVGIHLVLATQRPSVDVITGLIKANVPSRISFRVASGVDSGVILDGRGAEKLMGGGDMLYQPVDADGGPSRLQAAFLDDKEIDAVVGHWKRSGRKPDYFGQLGAELLEQLGVEG